MEKIRFVRLRTGSPCPHCRQDTVQRLKRRDWMRRLSSSKYYKCAGCKTRFLALYGFAIRLPKDG